ncbi:transposase (plasmid) [Rhizobium sp. CC1099]|uniref:transposase n=1 Tax=Rhizobium sp. CC1099 TaxID=3039160 RepID=UPI0024B1E23C|nr:transposase [Rhizobium sp. CC1099]WFU89997.1 transposase [Rhizobium sp. CC1099]
MGKRKFNDEEVTDILKEHQAGATVSDVCQRYGISQPTFYRWHSLQLKDASLDAKRMRALELENQKLKKLLAKAITASMRVSVHHHLPEIRMVRPLRFAGYGPVVRC